MNGKFTSVGFMTDHDCLNGKIEKVAICFI